MHGRSRMTIDPHIPTIPGRSMSGFHRPGRHCLHQAGVAGRGRGYIDLSTFAGAAAAAADVVYRNYVNISRYVTLEISHPTHLEFFLWEFFQSRVPPKHTGGRTQRNWQLWAGSRRRDMCVIIVDASLGVCTLSPWSKRSALKFMRPSFLCVPYGSIPGMLYGNC